MKTTSLMSFEQLCDLFNYEPKKRLLTVREAADVLRVHYSTLEAHRLAGTGPRFFRPPKSRRVLYSEKDLLAWLSTGERYSTSSAA